MRGSKNPQWKGGIAEYPNHYEMKLARKKKLESVNYVCEICGRRATEIHHIDRSKTNHNPNNLMAVCHKCHLGKMHKRDIGRKRYFSKEELELLEISRNNGATFEKLASQYGCSGSTISKVLNGSYD